jgi:hypothetical protein
MKRSVSFLAVLLAVSLLSTASFSDKNVRSEECEVLLSLISRNFNDQTGAYIVYRYALSADEAQYQIDGLRKEMESWKKTQAFPDPIKRRKIVLYQALSEQGCSK